MASSDIPSGATSRVTSAARTHAGVAMAVIVVGMVLQGMSKAPRSAFLVTFVDDNVEKTRTGFHMGIITTFGMMGPALAFLLGGIFTKMYVTLEETNLHPRHPKWIGAWWLGYLVFGCASCVFALPLFMFPRRIKEPLSEKKSIRRNSKPGVVGELSTLVKGLVGALYRLLSNPVYMCTMLSACALLFSVAGGQSFTAKYIENQFSLTAWRTNLSMAATLLGTACLGTFFGGYVSKRFKMGAVSSLKFIVVMQILSVVATSLGLAFKCEQPNIHNSPGPRAIFEEAMSGCYDGCACDDDDYFPICDGDGRTFFSPCHAGCSGNIGNDYVNCTCIPGSKASAGMCDYSCFMFYPFIASVCASTLFGTLSIIPKLVVYIRCVEDRDRPIALGLSAFMQSLTGWMLAPIVFGKLIDDICIQWENGEDSCTGRGACRLYDNDVFRWKLIGYQALFRFVGLVFTFSSLVIAVVTKKFDSVETENLNTLDAFEQVTRPFKTADKATDITNFPV